MKKPRLRLVNPFYVPTAKELEKILQALTPASARRFFLALCNTGCRLGELLRANVRDADFERDLLRVIRKGNRLDFVPINEILREVIEEELATRGDVMPVDPLFVNRRGNRYTTIKRPLATACRKAGVPRCTHHSLRHAYATLLYESGERVETISTLLGHTTPTTTRNIYVHWKDSDVRRAAGKIRIGKK